MADDKDPLGLLTPKTAPQADPLGLLSKKKVDTTDGENTLPSSSNGLNPFQSSQQNISYAPITDPKLRQETRNRDIEATNQQVKARQELSDKFKKIRSELPADAQANWDNAVNLSAEKPLDKLREPSQEELAHDQFMQTPLGKTLGTVAYLGSKATKGTLQIAKGTAWLMNKAGLSGAPTQQAGQVMSDLAFDKADEAANYGLTKNDQSKFDQNKITSNLGGVAEFLPAIAAGGPTFYLQGMGMGKETADAAEKNGAKINPTVKDAFILGTGVANGFLMKALGEGVFSKLPAGLRGDIASKISMDAIKEAGNKELTGEQFQSLINDGVKKWGDKVAQTGLNALKGYNKAVVDLSALAGTNFALKKGVDVANDKPVFNETLGDLAENVNNIATEQAPFFAGIGELQNIGKLTNYSDYKNSVVESLMKDPSAENVDRIKQTLHDHGFDQNNRNQWSPEEMDATFKQIDNIADVAKKLPKGIEGKNVVPAVDLINGRTELQKQLQEEQANRAQLDESVKDIPTAHEQLLVDKIDQANDKLKDIATGSKTTYSKGVGDEEGKFFKTVNGKKEEITPSRYELENLERTAKSKNNATTETESPVTNEVPQTNETGEPEATSENIPETNQNNININSENNESNQENQSSSQAESRQGESVQESGAGTSQNGEEGNQAGRENGQNEGEVLTNSGVAETAPDITNQNQEGVSNAIETREQQQSSEPEHQGTIEQQQGQQENRVNQEEPVSQGEAKTSGSNSPEQSTQEQVVPNEPTGIRNADVAAEREQAGKPQQARERLTKPEIEAEGKRLVDSGEIDPDVLAQDIITKKTPINAEQQAALLYHKTKLKNQLRSVLKEETTPETVSEQQIQVARLNDLIDANQQATEMAGNITGRALGFRTETMNEDYSRNTVFRRAKLANDGKDISKKDETYLDDHTKTITELEDKLAQREEQIRKLYEEGIVNKVKRTSERVERDAKREITKANLKKERENLLTDLHTIAKKSLGSAGANKIPVEMLVPLGKLARNYVLDGVVTISGVADKIYTDLKDHIEGLNKADIEEVIKDHFDTYLAEQNKVRLDRAKKLQQKKLDTLKEQSESGNFEKKVAYKIQVDNDYLRIRAEINRQQTLINKRIADIENSNKSLGGKSRDFLVKWGRNIKLTGIGTIGKLMATGLTTIGLKGVTEGIGGIYSVLLPKIAKKSTIEGGINTKALATSIAKAATQGLKDAYDEINLAKGGQSELSALYKNRLGALPAEAADFFGHLHSAIKAPVKRHAFEYSYAKRIARGIEQGIDVQDPVIDAKNRLDAYKDGERAIFMGDNAISKAYESALSPLEKGNNTFGKNIAATARILLPFVKVPTNIALSTFRHTFGLPMGIAKLGQVGLADAFKRAGAERIARVIHSGLGELKPEEADLVLRNLKHGSIGAAALLIGYFNPQNVGGFYQPNEKRKQRDAKADELKLFGHDVPKILAEHPIFQAMQVGATYRRVMDKYRHKDDRISQASLATVSGLVEGIPLANEAKVFTDLLGSPHKFNQFVSRVVKGEIEPAVLQEIARHTDTKDNSPVAFKEENLNKRKPDDKHGLLRFLKQDLMQGIPILRKKVPKKH